jgi:hypothetical protein
MESDDIARYIEATDKLSQPWLLVLWRVKKLKEQRGTMPEAEYMQEIEGLHRQLMGLGEWWVGREDEFF